MDENFKKAWHIYSQKACSNRATSQMAAFNAWRTIESYLTPEEKDRLGVALSHAWYPSQEGPREFDHVCKDIAKRLGILKVKKCPIKISKGT